MKKVYQTIFDADLGDCFRACVASIFEFPIENMPNFWTQTQDVDEFWDLVDAWTIKHLGFRCISFRFNKPDLHLVKGVLCIACASSPRNKEEDHAVVWLDGIIHDPHPLDMGLAESPNTFTLFIPLDPKKGGINATIIT